MVGVVVDGKCDDPLSPEFFQPTKNKSESKKSESGKNQER